MQEYMETDYMRRPKRTLNKHRERNRTGGKKVREILQSEKVHNEERGKKKKEM